MVKANHAVKPPRNFRDELVVRRKWIDEPGYGDLLKIAFQWTGNFLAF
ncbi:MAG: hypothetical protein WAN81_12215 [Candidatus Binataceae bacterium]